MRRPRLLLADDHTHVTEGLKRLLEADYELVGAVEDGQALVSEAVRLKPDVVLLDISMPRVNGIDAARQLQQDVPQARLIFVTAHSDPVYVAEALRVGASGYVLKQSAASELVDAVREALAGRRYVTPLVPVETWLSSPGRPEVAPSELTGRQREVLRLIADGLATKEIAAILQVSAKTVEFHKSNIIRKLGLRTTAELTKYAVRHGLTSM